VQGYARPNSDSQLKDSALTTFGAAIPLHIPLKNLANAINLVPVDSLATYEQPDLRRVAEIALSLNRTRMLCNPIIADGSRNLLIDGHHRVEAFRWMGLRLIPCFMVPYLSEAVQVRGWSRVTYAPERLIEDAFTMLHGDVGGPWTVAASNSRGQMIARKSFEESTGAARYIDRLALLLSSTGYVVRITPTGRPAITPKAGQLQIYLDPVVGKEEVLSAADRRELFPQQVNRHLIHGRPIGMRIPLKAMERTATFEYVRDSILRRTPPTLLSAGRQIDNRFYEERVYDFSGEMLRLR
jgi:hypothetical protein